MVGGCDASLLISSNSFASAEPDVDTALELQCPGIVSCADIIATATRDLITMAGGPFYNIRLGRKDSFESYPKDGEGHIARPNMTMDTIINMFASKNLSVQEMVALVGAHTIGFSRSLRNFCENNSKHMAAFNDVVTPGKFDNIYYINLQKGLGLLASDQTMISDQRTKTFVELNAKDPDAFFKAFAHAMEKVSVYQVKIRKMGEVRRRCDVVNHLQGNC
ncbi:unnamed protein product [Withania somnifera]